MGQQLIPLCGRCGRHLSRKEEWAGKTVWYQPIVFKWLTARMSPYEPDLSKVVYMSLEARCSECRFCKAVNFGLTARKPEYAVTMCGMEGCKTVMVDEEIDLESGPPYLCSIHDLRGCYLSMEYEAEIRGVVGCVFCGGPFRVDNRALESWHLSNPKPRKVPTRVFVCDRCDRYSNHARKHTCLVTYKEV